MKSIPRFWRIGVHQNLDSGGFPLFWKSVAGNAVAQITTTAFFSPTDLVGGSIASGESVNGGVLTAIIDGGTIATAESVNGGDMLWNVVLIGGEIASEESVNGGDLGAIIAGGDVASAEAVNGGDATWAALEGVQVEYPPEVSKGSYDSINQRTDAYASRDGSKYDNVSYKWDGRYQGITQKRPADLDEIEDQDRIDLRDIMTTFREYRRAA